MDSWKQGMELPGDTLSYSPNLHPAVSLKWEDCPLLMGKDGLESRSRYGLPWNRTSPISTGRIIGNAKMDELGLLDDQSFMSSFSGLAISSGYSPYDLKYNPNIPLESQLYYLHGENAESHAGCVNSFQLQNSLYRGTKEDLLMSGMVEDLDALKFSLLAVQSPDAGFCRTHVEYDLSNPLQNVAAMSKHPGVAADFGRISDEQLHFFARQQRQASENLIPSRTMLEPKSHVNYRYNEVQKPLDAQHVQSMIHLLDEQKRGLLSYRNELPCPAGTHPTSGLRFHSLSYGETPEANINSLPIDKSISWDLLKYFSRPNNTGKCAYILAKDQEGCRYLQRKILEGKKNDIEKILLEVTDRMVELTMDPFGNYLVQKLFEACDNDQKTRILRVITRTKGDLLHISCDMHGTRVVQKIVESLRIPEHFSIVVSSLRPNILTLMKNVNGNHVAQHCLRYLPSKHMELLLESVASNCVELATDRHGCCVLQKCIAHSSGEQRFLITYAIALNSRVLSQDEFGNYAVQYILDKDDPRATEDVLDHLEGHLVDLSMQKYSSNVVESCLKLAREERRACVIQELIGSPRLDQILQDPYGNYVIQSAIMASKGALRSAIVKAIKPYIPTLIANPYGKKVLSSKCLKNVKWHLV
ncbi:hypothetical protein MLD38_017112 [Melastoma candidum]|uniref:Uncharacterized protein n=1 Tax=Melastoma candidum TaxID=119954 RepID=A0ACB9QTL9_9MYRT|nr:hypothetical protein MLD38_017112 [Melastoma candidum]